MAVTVVIPADGVSGTATKLTVDPPALAPSALKATKSVDQLEAGETVRVRSKDEFEALARQTG